MSLRSVCRVLTRTCRPTRTSTLLEAQTLRWHGGPTVANDAPTVTVTFVQPDGTPRAVQARVGESLLQTAHRHEIDLEGACEGVCACSTCHLILPHDVFDSLDEPSEDEEDMLDMAFGLTETSRLGCQIVVREDMDGVELQMPSATRNFYVGTSSLSPYLSSPSIRQDEPWIGFAARQDNDLKGRTISLTVDSVQELSKE